MKPAELKTPTARAIALVLAITATGAMAVPQRHDDTRPRINLFPTRVVESLNATSETARSMEGDMYTVVEKLENQQQAYRSTACEGSSDSGCLRLRSAIRASYREMLEVMQQRIPDMRDTLDITADAMADSLRGEIGRKMTPGDVQRTLAGRPTAAEPLAGVNRIDARKGKLSQMFSRYYDLVRRGGRQGEALPVLASQIYLDSMESLYYLELIEAEIGSQSTELVLELEWGELTDQMTNTVSGVKTLLWGEENGAEEILNVGLETELSRDTYSDLLID